VHKVLRMRPVTKEQEKQTWIWKARPHWSPEPHEAPDPIRRSWRLGERCGASEGVQNGKLVDSEDASALYPRPRWGLLCSRRRYRTAVAACL